MKDTKINEKDIELLESTFNKIAQQWAEANGNVHICTELAKQELTLVFDVADKYKGFICNYDESEYDGENWYDKQVFTHTDFLECNINESNYGKADSVAFDLKEELVSYIKAINQDNDVKKFILNCHNNRVTILETDENLSVFDVELNDKEDALYLTAELSAVVDILNNGVI